MRTPAVIELGEDRGAPPPEPPPRLRWRPVAVVGVALTLLAALSASAVPAGPALIRVAAIPLPRGASYALVDDLVIVLAGPQEAGAAGGRPVSAYDLRTGEPRWTSRLSLSGLYGAGGTGGVVLLEGIEQRLGGPEPRTVAVDAATGEPLWRAPEHLRATAKDVVVTAPPPETGVAEVTGRDLRTGRVRWRFTSTPEGHPGDAFSGDGSLLVLLRPDGVAVVRDVVSGRVRRTATVAAAGTVGAGFAVVGGLLLVPHLRGREHFLSAFEVGTLRRRWTVSTGSDFVSAVPCGPVICAFLADVVSATDSGSAVPGPPPTTLGLDPGSGAARWRTDGFISPTVLAGDRYLVGWRYVASKESGQMLPESVVVDARTGATESLAPWQVIGQDGALLAAEGPGMPFPGGLTMPSGGAVWLGRLDTATAVTPVGRVEGVAGDCRPHTGWLTCGMADGTLGVWRYDTDPRT